METKTPSLEWQAEIRAQFRTLKADEEHLHNKVLHRSILETWKRESPQMWANLQRAMLAGIAYMVVPSIVTSILGSGCI